MTKEDVWETINALARQVDSVTKHVDSVTKHVDSVTKQVNDVTKQMGGLNNKFGSFTEGLAFPSMFKLLQTRFQCTFVAPRATSHKGAKSLELDVLAYSNGERNEAFVVEIKSHAKEDAVAQLVDQLEQFGRFFPEHRDKKLYGILAAVDISKEVAAKALKVGLYVARISEETFQLKVPTGFRPQSFQAKPA